ncbi:hypothetical protein ACJX0J_022712, partial [Zea mays]
VHKNLKQKLTKKQSEEMLTCLIAYDWLIIALLATSLWLAPPRRIYSDHDTWSLRGLRQSDKLVVNYFSFSKYISIKQIMTKVITSPIIPLSHTSQASSDRTVHMLNFQIEEPDCLYSGVRDGKGVYYLYRN